jgi:tryptophan-rich sensory protein
MIVAQKWVFHIWIGDKIQVDYSLSILFGLYCLVNMLNSIYNPFVNATSKIKLQMILYIILSIQYLIMAVIFVKYLNLGIKGIVLALILLHDLPLAIIMKIQSKKILSGAQGIWQQ